MKTLCAALFLTCSIATSAQTWVREPAPMQAVVRDVRLLREIMLAGHNEARAAVGAMPLAWDERLVRDAASYAGELARTERFQHSVQPHDATRQGENLFVGSRGDYSYAEMIGHWRAERRDFRPGIVPDVSRTGNFADVSHYANIIWPTTRRFGCAMAGNRRTEYLVCRYAPPGNMAGRRLG